MQSNKISFKGQKIFVGIDVHKSKWAVTALTESGMKKTFTQKPSANALFEFLKKHYPDGEYQAVYESGFTGLSTYYSLIEVGINCIIIHAADVPTTQYEEMMKTDKVDSAKLATSLRAGMLKPIYVRDKDSIDDRSVIRVRKSIQSQLASIKIRIKHMLMCHGVEYPERFEKSGSHWSRAFMKWLREEVRLMSSTRIALDLLLDHVEVTRQSLLKANRMLRYLSQTKRYENNIRLLLSIPGIGRKVGMCLATEINDIGRFHNERQFASYLGLIPSSHSSGEKITHGEKTFRGNKEIGKMIIESAWIAIRHDTGLACAYGAYRQRMNPQKAITKVARKMSNIIFAVLKNKKEYEPYKWDK